MSFPLLKVSQISVAYGVSSYTSLLMGSESNPHHSITHLSFQLQSDEIVMIAGPSGSGKTTLLRAIAGLTPLTQGEIELRRTCIERATQTEIITTPEERRVGFMAQSAPLFPHLTVYENIAFGLTTLNSLNSWFFWRPLRSLLKEHSYINCKKIESRVDTLLELVELQEFKRSRPHELSGGQRRRVALAQTLAPQRDLYLLDEPFSHLEPELRDRLAQRVIDLIHEQGSALLWASHELDLAFFHADRLGIMHRGELLALEPPQHLFDKPPHIEVSTLLGALSWCELPPLSSLDRLMLPHWLTDALKSLRDSLDESTSTQLNQGGELQLGWHRDSWSYGFYQSSHGTRRMPLQLEVQVIQIQLIGSQCIVTLCIDFTNINQSSLYQEVSSSLRPLILSANLPTYQKPNLMQKLTLSYHGALFWSHTALRSSLISS